MAFTYTTKGVTLSMSDMVGIHKYYEAACTAEYLMENYEQVTSEEQALKLGYEVRRKMNKWDYTEEDAIDEVMAENLYDEDEE